MLEHLLQFIDTDEEKNPVLSGYFSKLLSIVVNYKEDDFLEYIYKVNTNVLLHMTKHLYSRSISEIFVKIMLSEKLKADNLEGVIEFKREVILRILNNLEKGTDNKELYLNTNYIVNEFVSNKSLFAYFIEESFLSKLLDLLNHDDVPRFVCVCKMVSTIIAQQKKNSGNSQQESHQNFFDDEDDVMIDQMDDETKKEPEAVKMWQNPLIKLAGE